MILAPVITPLRRGSREGRKHSGKGGKSKYKEEEEEEQSTKAKEREGKYNRSLS